MATIWTKRAQLIGTISELTGYKSGLALTRQEFDELVPASSYPFWHGDFDDVIGVRPEEVEDLFANILFRLGNAKNPSPLPVSMMMMYKYQKDPMKSAALRETLKIWMSDIQKLVATGAGDARSPYDPEPLLRAIRSEFGREGLEPAFEFLEALDESLHKSPWTLVRRLEWRNVEELSALFHTQSATAVHGEYFDQRFVDYLAVNFDKVDQINWRRFEALTCEFFLREGFLVEIGPGSNDDGVDARVWRQDSGQGEAPDIIVQCKREKARITKVVVKGLYADVLEERAKAGLIVTTSTLSPGAETTRVARRYPIQVADRAVLRTWIERMRTPGRGVFLSE